MTPQRTRGRGGYHHADGQREASLVRSGVTQAIVDALIAAAALAVALALREGVLPALTGIAPFRRSVSYLTLWPVLPLLIALRAAVGLYPGHGRDEVAQLRDQTLTTLLTGVTVIAFGALFRFDQAYSRLVLIGWFTLLIPALPLARAATRALLARRTWFGVPVELIGSPDETAALERALRERPAFGLRPAAAERAIGAVVRLRDLRDQGWDTLALRYPRVWVVTDAWPAAIPASVTAIDDRVALELHARLLTPGNRAMKRLLDVAISLAALPAIALASGAIALAIALSSRGPLLIGHERVGQSGRRFQVWKFRTMIPDAAARLPEILAADPALAEEWARTQKLRHDPRVTRIGRWLRRTSLDEIPQVINVLRGDMSWVGPRPVVADELARYGERAGLYLRVRPGISGLVQVSGRSNLPYARRVELDAYYVRNWSVWLDLMVLARTVDVVLRRRGAV
jgi:lipopolysaccharide/colanic/teichoic acid biosynthesis glycosyltransferase